MSQPIPRTPNQKPPRFPRVPVELDRPRTMRLTWGAIRWIRDETQFARGYRRQRMLGRELTLEEWPEGLDLSQGLAPDAIDEVADLPIILAGLLRDDDPEITADAAESMLLDHQEAVIRGIFRAIGQDLPETAEQVAERKDNDAEEGDLPHPLGKRRRRPPRGLGDRAGRLGALRRGVLATNPARNVGASEAFP